MTNNLPAIQQIVSARHVALSVLMGSLWLGACSTQEPQVQEPLKPAQSYTSVDDDSAMNTMDNKGKERTADQPVPVKGGASATSVETVGSIAYDGTSVNATVVSTGCTTSDHFSVEHKEDNGACHVLLVRNKADFCRRAPFTASVSVPWEASESCASASIVFDNPVVDLTGATSRKSTQR